MFHEGDVLRKWREELGWTQEDVAAKALIHKMTVNYAEAGRNSTVESLRAIVTALGHTLEELHGALKPYGDLRPNEVDLLMRLRRLPERPREQVFSLVRAMDEERAPSTEPAHQSLDATEATAARTTRGRRAKA